MKFSPPLAAGWIVLAALAAGAGLRAADDATAARRVLRAALVTESGWPKVHAAEVLAAHGDPGAARAAFLAELATHGGVPRDRIGIHRVLARTAGTAAARRAEVAWLAGVLADPQAPDRVLAAETLGKLGGPPEAAVLAAARDWLATAEEEDAVFLQWLCWQAGDDDARRAIVGRLRSPRAATRLRAAYVLRLTGTAEPAALAELARAAAREPVDSPARAIVVGAAYHLQAAPAQCAAWRAALEQLVADGPPTAAYDALQALLPGYTAADVPRLRPLLAHAHSDVRTAAAWALLAIDARSARP